MMRVNKVGFSVHCEVLPIVASKVKIDWNYVDEQESANRPVECNHDPDVNREQLNY